MNLALHGLSGDIRLGNTYYDDLHKSVDKFDFVMANPPFNGPSRTRPAPPAEVDEPDRVVLIVPCSTYELLDLIENFVS